MKRSQKRSTSKVDRLLACEKEAKVKRSATRGRSKTRQGRAKVGFGPQEAASFRSFCQIPGMGSEDECMVALISGLGHVADRRGLDFYELVSSAIGHWHIERCEPFSNKYVNVHIGISAPQ